MRINQKGIDLIKECEGLCLNHYKCPAGFWTVGYGHTGKLAESDRKITPEEAEEILKQDLREFERGVEEMVKVPLTENQFSALVSFSFNLGLGNLRKSTLLKKLNGGDFQGAAEEFPNWKKAGGRVLEGLIKRRAAERELFLS